MKVMVFDPHFIQYRGQVSVLKIFIYDHFLFHLGLRHVRSDNKLVSFLYRFHWWWQDMKVMVFDPHFIQYRGQAMQLSFEHVDSSKIRYIAVNARQRLVIFFRISKIYLNKYLMIY